MSDIKLFRITPGSVSELDGYAVALERSLQTLIETHLETLLGVRFLATEYTTGRAHGGRIDTLGIDENGCPVIVEYKRATNENVINQGLFYLDWLLDHKAEFQLLVLDRLGKDVADSIEWSSPRLLCIAGDFTRYDQHAVQQIDRNIELLRYRRYGEELLLLELVNAVSTGPTTKGKAPGLPPTPGGKAAKSVQDYLDRSDTDLKDLYESLKTFLLNLGDDVQLKMLKWYVAFRRIRNFACIQIHPQKAELLVFIKVDPATVQLESGIARDDSAQFGALDLKLTIRTPDDLERTKPLLLRSYEGG